MSDNPMNDMTQEDWDKVQWGTIVEARKMAQDLANAFGIPCHILYSKSRDAYTGASNAPDGTKGDPCGIAFVSPGEVG